MRKLFFIFILLPCLSLGQDKLNKNLKAGFALQAGTGIVYGGIGGLVEDQFVLKKNIRVTPWAGLGFSIGSAAPPDTIGTEGKWLNSALGINLEFGDKHRLIGGPQLITAYYGSAAPPGKTIARRGFVGYSFIGGYKGTASFGLIWQVYGGLAHMPDPLMDGRNWGYFAVHAGVGLGFKF